MDLVLLEAIDGVWAGHLRDQKARRIKKAAVIDGKFTSDRCF